MMKNCLLAVVVLGLLICAGCAKGGNGVVGGGITISVSNPRTIYPNEQVTFTATVMGTSNTTVTWSLSGSACTGSSNPCGSIGSTSGVYTAPPAPPNPASVTVVATSAANSGATGVATFTVQLIQVFVTPTTVLVGQNLVQQFTAVAVPDVAPQTFTWTCTPTGSCGNVVQDAHTSGLAVYTAPNSTGSVVIAATSTVTQSSPSVGQSKVTVVPTRLPAGQYAFRFAGFDAGNHSVNTAGTITVGANTAITGFEDVQTAGATTGSAITSGSYVPTTGVNSNNLGTLTLNLTGGVTNKYDAVINSSGVIRMVESDNTGVQGSGVMQKAAANTVFNAGAQIFAFGFTGTDSSGKRVGYAGLLPLDGSGNVGSATPAIFDANDNGTNVCGAQPCTIQGTYTADLSIAGLWHLTLALSSGSSANFDFFVSAGQTSKAPSPLTLYAVSTDPIDATHPALAGSLVYQFPMTYNNAGFVGSSVSSLTGANANVSLTLGTTDGTSGGTGGAGKFTGNFDWNNNGTIVSASSFSYTYVASNSNNGRYTFQMLGNPGANPVVASLPFVLYASGANRGFLLDQSSSAVITGSMDPQPAKSVFYTNSEMPGTYAAVTTPNSNTNVIEPVVQNLLLTSPGGSVFNVAGTQNPGNQSISGSYNLGAGGAGYGSLTFTTPPAPSAATNAIYAVDFDSTNFAVLDFFMIGTTSGTPSAIMFAQQ